MPKGKGHFACTLLRIANPPAIGPESPRIRVNYRMTTESSSVNRVFSSMKCKLIGWFCGANIKRKCIKGRKRIQVHITC